jgi:hypothetical protein
MRGAVVQLKMWWLVIGRVQAEYRRRHGRWPALWRPRRYTEKMQWRKLFDLDPRYGVLSDKLAVRDFIELRLGPGRLVPLLWQGDDPERIPFDRLDPPYVLKSSHGCGHTKFVRAGEAVDRQPVMEMARRWLGHCHGTAMDEPGYVPVPRRLLVERQVVADDGGVPLERRFFVFDGRVRVVNTVFVEDGAVRNGAFHTPDWVRLPWHFTRDLAAMAFARPVLLEQMADAAARLGAGFEHVRVDIYDGGGRFWIGEVTVYPWSGFATFRPDAADFEMGRFWRLRGPVRRGLAAVLSGACLISPRGRIPASMRDEGGEGGEAVIGEAGCHGAGVGQGGGEPGSAGAGRLAGWEVAGR